MNSRVNAVSIILRPTIVSVCRKLCIVYVKKESSPEYNEQTNKNTNCS